MMTDDDWLHWWLGWLWLIMIITSMFVHAMQHTVRYYQKCTIPAVRACHVACSFLWCVLGYSYKILCFVKF